MQSPSHAKQRRKTQPGKESQAESLSREKENIMNGKLTLLEKLIKDQAKPSEFSKTELSVYPEPFRHVHAYNLFGKDLLAIPASLLIEEDDDEFEHPFNFTDNIEVINLFESEFRAAIPNEFVQIGSLYDSTEIVLLHKLNEPIHVFHVSDIADNDWLNSKLKNPICRLNTFIEKLRQQTVCCLINPQNYSQYELLEIRHSKTVVTEEYKKDFEIADEAFIEYINIIKKSINKGFQIHYAPKRVIDELNNESTNS